MTVSLDASKDAMRRCASSLVANNLVKSFEEYGHIRKVIVDTPWVTINAHAAVTDKIAENRENKEKRLNSMSSDFASLRKAIGQTVDSGNVSQLIKFHTLLLGVIESCIYEERSMLDALTGGTCRDLKRDVDDCMRSTNEHTLITLGSISHYELT